MANNLHVCYKKFNLRYIEMAYRVTSIFNGTTIGGEVNSDELLIKPLRPTSFH